MSDVLDASPTLDPRELRQTLGRFATGITVISARTAAGEEAAITANSFTSVSLEPPLVLWSVAREAFSASVFQRATHFVVHVLSEQQQDISQHFARRQPDKLTTVAHTRDADGGLELPGWLARLTCEPHQCIEAGDHWVFIARVVSMAHTEDRPLLYFGGGYQTLMPQPQA
jgi:flavin reductase (DIM6/NTAB) family NADH-FMN oxidoreductase RutF